jgi:hypothetical protein
MKHFISLLILFQVIPASSSSFDPRKLYDKVDRDWIHGGFVGVEVPWTCAVGQNGSKSHLPESTTIKLKMNRLGEIGIKPDIFKTNKSLGNLFGKLFRRKNIIPSAAYKDCIDDFLVKVQVKLNEYRIQSCSEDITKNPACQSSVEDLVTKVRTQALKSPYLKVNAAVDTQAVEAPVVPAKTQTQTQTQIQPPTQTITEVSEPPKSTSPKTHLGLMGGGGEPAGPTTIFDNFLGHLGRTNPKMSWTPTISFNGGHSATEALLAEKFPRSPSKPFTTSQYEDMIKDYEDKIKSGEIKSGEQLLLMFQTHGSEGIPPNQTHFISAGVGAVSDYSTLKGSNTVSLDRLKSLVSLAESKGVKLGIVDMSCHSGMSLSLASDKTCVVTSTGPKHFSYGNQDSVFSSAFARDLKPGMSLEEAYLEGRRNSFDSGFPMISSETGKTIQDRLYPLISNYIHYYSNTQATKFPNALDAAYDAGSCSLETSTLNEILALTKDIEGAVSSDLSDFETAITNYANYRLELMKELDNRGVKDVAKDFKFCGPKNVVVTSDSCYVYKGRELLTIDVDTILESQREKPGATEFWMTVKDKQQELLQQHPGLKDLKNFYANVPNLQEKTYDLAGKVTLEARKLYDKLYAAEAKKSTKPNPCKDFVL